MSEAPTTPAPPAVKRGGPAPWLGYLLALAGLAWVLHDIHPRRVLADLEDIRWSWIVLGIGLEVSSYAVQGLRWRLLLDSLGRTRVRQTIRAIFAGLFANSVLPFRTGELLRPYLVSRDTGISFEKVVASLGVERLLDGVILGTAVGAVALVQPLPGFFNRAAVIFGGLMLTLLFLFLAAVIFVERRDACKKNSAEPEKQPGPLGRWLRHFLDGLHVIGTSPRVYEAGVISILVPAMQILAVWSMNRGYGLDLSIGSMMIVHFIILLGVVIPNAPGNVGAWQFFCVLGLTVFDVDKSDAAGFSIVAYFFLTLPPALVGFFAVVRSGLRAAHLRDQLQRMTSAGPEESPSASVPGA